MTSKAKNKKQYDMHLILNTHWDREYRWSFRETQMRLMEAGDILIDTMEHDSRFKYFHPDSQASFLDDYLELRPENRERVKTLVADGRILVGPWYTLPAEFLVSGESLVRNLLAGHRIANELGGVMKTAYNIFSWGQVSQLPQIYRQFGMDTIMFYRGIDQSKLDRLEFSWTAPDGSKALGITFGSYHRLNFWIYVYKPYIHGKEAVDDLVALRKNGGSMARVSDSYSDDINFHVMHQPKLNDMEAALSGMQTLLDTVKDKSSTNRLLFLQGFDQENPDPVVPDLVEAINKRIDYGKLHISSLPEYVRLVRGDIKKLGLEAGLKNFHGEMLSVETSGDPFAPLYNGVFSARMPVKLQNADCQYRLEKWAEPASVWQLLQGKEYPERLLRLAWLSILQNQQHDGIGGCHVDRVQLAMEERYRQANDISETITRDALTGLVAEIDLSKVKDREIGLVIFNSTCMARKEVVQATVDVPRDWGFRDMPGNHYKTPMMLEIYDARGRKVKAQMLGMEDDTGYGYLKFGNAFSFDVTRVNIAFEVDVPSMGYASYVAKPLKLASRPVETLQPEPLVMENEYLRAEICGDGTINLLHREEGRWYRKLNHFEDEGECGGPLVHYRANTDPRYITLGVPATISLLKAGPLMVTYRIEREWLLPESLESELKVHVPHGNEWVDHGAAKRSSTKKAVKIVSDVTLTKGSRVLEFVTTVENTIQDHRLRVMFPVGLARAKVCHVDSPFDVVERPITVPDSTGWYEEASRTMPTASFVDVSAGGGLAVIHYGLSEYEVVDDPTRTIALTLLRCFGTAGNPTEKYVEQKLAQCQGKHTFRYGACPHAGNWEAGLVTQEAQCFNAPLRVVQSTGHAGNLPATHSFFAADKEAFVVTALKKAEAGKDVILRGFNPTRKKIIVSLSAGASVKSASLMTLEEQEIRALQVRGGRIRFDVKAGEIVSVKMSVR
jgi:alpha-mannosidase